MSNRRQFITLLGGAAAWPLAARAQQAARVPRIGIIDDAPMWHSFRQALRELGYVEGQRINYEYRYSEGAPDRLATVVSELVRRPVDLIAAYGTPPMEAAKAATTTIPIVMVGVADPVRAGLVASLARPVATLPAIPCSAPTSAPSGCSSCAKRSPRWRASPISPIQPTPPLLTCWPSSSLQPRPAGMTLIGVELGSASDFDASLAVMLRERTEVLMVSNDTFHQLHAGRIIAFLVKNRIAACSRPRRMWQPVA